MMQDGANCDLVSEVLDQQLIDFIGRPMGSVDGLVLELREGEQPRVAFILTGGVTLARRLPRPFSTVLTWMARRWGGTRGEPYRIPWEKLKCIGIDVEVNVDTDATPATYWEHRLRRAIERMPV